MNPVHLDFAENQRWRGVWALAAVIGTLMLGAAAWRWVPLNTAVIAEAVQMAASQTQLQQARTPVQVKADPRQANVAQAAQLLQQDLNKAFATAENLQVPGVRLRGLSLDNTAGVLRLDYDLDSIVKAAAVTEALNAGYESRPWQLEGVSGTAAAHPLVGNGSAMPMVPVAPVFRGVWGVRLRSL